MFHIEKMICVFVFGSFIYCRIVVSDQDSLFVLHMTVKPFTKKKKVFMLFMLFSDIICSTELKNYAYSSSVAKVYAVKFYIISITAWYFGLSYFGILVDTIFLMLKRMRKYYRVFPLLWDFFDLWMCKRCPYSELFWSAFFPPFPYSDWLRRVYLTWFYQFWGLRKRCFDAKKIALFWF